MLITRFPANGWRRASVATAIGIAGLCLGLLAARPEAAPTPPDVAAVQAAYDALKVDGSPNHINDLQVRTSDCNPLADRGYGCQISYIRKSSVKGRLYFDVVTLEPQRHGWKLVSGLCRGSHVERSL